MAAVLAVHEANDHLLDDDTPFRRGSLRLRPLCSSMCVCVDLPTIINWFRKLQEFFLNYDFLGEEAHECVQAHGSPEAKEPKGTEPSILQKDIKPVQATEKGEVAPVNPIQATGPDAVKAVNDAMTLPETSGEVGFELTEIPSDKQVQKEWTCAMCRVKVTSERILNIHLQGRKHMNASERLTNAKNQPCKGNVGSGSAVEPRKHGSISNIQGSQKKQKPPKGQVSAASSVAPMNSDPPSNNPSTCDRAVNPKPDTGECNLPKEESEKSLPTTNMTGNQVKSSANVEGLQQVGKEHGDTKIPQFRCTICNVTCSRSEDLNCHLWGRKHLAQIQKLNNLQKSERT
ncbi:uncharacterized protein LOC120171417 [Hibiscus syriacus]|uniref:uncharacterized protein LOC120171417 n=1 Tax=Hibiscus syriacus TaxID=106335 RepID=UPI0019209AD2|nr:uncharacterized protein LOC120171417 [Hibiscus syriacus]